MLIHNQIFCSTHSKNNRGLSLVELLIVAAMLGGMSLVAMNLTKQSTKSSVKYQLDSDVNLTTNEINAILSNPATCKATFTTATPTSINNKYYISTHGSAPTSGYGNGGLKIASYVLTSPAANTGLLTILYKNKNILNGSPYVTRKINLYIEGAPAAVTLCRSLSTTTTDIWSHATGSDIYYIGGNVGIGTATPGSALEVKGSTVSSASALNITDSSGYSKFSVRNDGKIGIGIPSTAAATAVLQIGDVGASTGFYSALSPQGTKVQVETSNRGITVLSANQGTTSIPVLIMSEGPSYGSSPLEQSYLSNNVALSLSPWSSNAEVEMLFAGWMDNYPMKIARATSPTARIAIGTKTTEVLSVLYSGKVGIGNPSPNATLRVDGTGENIIVGSYNGTMATGYSWSAVLGSNTSTSLSPIGVYGYAMNGASNSGIGGTFYGNGSAVVATGTINDFYATGPGIDYATASSIRWKTNVKVLTGALDNVLKLRGVRYDMSKEHGGGRQVGFIGEEVGKYYPEIVSFDSESEDPSYYITGLDYSKMTPVLLEAIKELYHKWFKDSSSIHREIAELKIKARNVEELNKVQVDVKFEAEKVKSEVESAKKDKEIAKLKKENEEIKAQLQKIEKMILKRKP